MTSSISGEIRLKLEQLVDGYVTSGAKAPEVIDTVLRELRAMRAAYERDPDPADDPVSVEEPANDWPDA